VSDSANIALGFDARRAKEGAEEFKRAGEAVIGTGRAVEAATASQAKATETAAIRQVEAFNKQQRAVDALARRLDPLGQSVREATRDLERLQRISSGTGEAAERAAGLIAAAQTRVSSAQAALAASMRGAEVASKSYATQTGQTSMAVRQLGIQSIDVFQQLASGAPVMMTLIQQGGQVGQVMANSGTSIGSVVRSVGGLIASNAGVIAAGAALLGVGAAIFTVAKRASDLEAEQRQLSVAIAGVGRSAELSSGQLQGYVSSLKQQGVAAAEATTAIATLARNSGLSSGMIGRIAGIAPDAAAARGVSVPDMMKELAEAAKGSGEAVQKLDDAFNLLTPNQAANVRVMLEHGDKASALALVFDTLQSRVTGLAREALSPADQAARDLGNAWSGFIDKVAKSDLVIGAIERLASALRSIAGLIGPSGTTGSSLSTIDAQIAALSGDIPGTNATAARLRRDQTEARARLVAQRNAEAQALADAAEFGGGIPSTAVVSMPGMPSAASGGSAAAASAKELDRLAAQRVASTPTGQIATYRIEIEKFQKELASLGPRTSDNAARFDVLTQAIKADEKAIADLAKKNEEHRTGLEKAGDTIAAETKAYRELAAAYGVNADAVARITAAQEAEKKAISEGLQPGTAKYAATVADLTTRLLARNEAQAGSKAAQHVAELDEATAAQNRITEAYDGTTASLERAQAQEKAHAAALRSGLTPGMKDYEAAVSKLSDSYVRSSDAAREFQHVQSSVAAILGTLETTADRIGQALVDGFLNGRNAAVNMASVVRAAFASLATEAARLGVINPLINGVLGTSRPSLWTGLSTLAGNGASGASGGGSLLGTASNALSLARLGDTFGLTDIGGRLSSFGEYIGLTGDGGLLSGIGSTVGGLLSTGINGVSLGAATNAALAGMGGTLGPATPAAVLSAQGGATIGQALGGFGIGFAGGSMLGGALQRTLNKTGPAPTIGAGLGALAGVPLIPVLGPLAPIVGGLLGGAGGSLIGPRPATPFSATGLTVGADGMLAVGRTFSQIVDTTAEVQALQQQVSALNSLLSSTGARITNGVSNDEFGQARLIGGTTGEWLNFGQGGGRPGDLNAAFGELRFRSDNQYVNRGLSGQSFASAEALQAAVTEMLTFVNQTAPALKALSDTEVTFGAGSLSATIDGLAKQFDDAKAMADKLGFAEFDLAAARAQALQIANDNAAKQMLQNRQDLETRYYAARGANTGNIQMQLDNALTVFDRQAEAQRSALRDQMLSLFGDAFEQTAAFAERMALLEATLGEERLATAKNYFDAMQAAGQQSTAALNQAASSASSIVASITDYVRGVRFGSESPLPANDRYSAASAQFEQAIAAAQAGDAGAIRNLTAFAETFRSSSRAMNGSGAQFVTDVNRIVTALEGFAGQSPEALTSAIYTTEMRTQTATLASLLTDLRTLTAQVRDEIRRGNSGPPAARAA
jgi:hypothetical protein